MFKKKTRYIGVDVGGTKMLLQTFDKRMNLVEEKRMPTVTKKGQKGFLEGLEELIAQFMHRNIVGIGVALPGIVDQAKGVLVDAPHLPGKNLKLADILHKRFHKRVILDNDINAFLHAQKHRNAIKPYQNVVAVMVGTGVGGSALVNGEMMYGKNGFAGEVGHMVINSESKLKTLEQNCGGAFIPKICKELGVSPAITAYDLGASTPAAKKVKKHIVKHLGVGLANLSLVFNPSAIVLGGSIYKRHLKDSKKELQKIISKYTLDGKSPLIFDANPKNSAAEGMARLLSH